MVKKFLKTIDNFNTGMLGKKGSMKNASIFNAKNIKKSVRKPLGKGLNLPKGELDFR